MRNEANTFIPASGWWLYSRDVNCKHGTGHIDYVAGFAWDETMAGWLPVVSDCGYLVVVEEVKKSRSEFYFQLVREDEVGGIKARLAKAWADYEDEEDGPV